jgi:hypothetical protein
MLTTTISDAWSDGLDAKSPSALEYLQDCDRVFRQHVERVFGKVAYLWTVERGEEGGRWHRHYLWRWRTLPAWHGRRGWLPKTVLKKLQSFAKSAGLGRMDWQPIDDDRAAARYASKYVAKLEDADLEAPAVRDPLCVCHPSLSQCLCGAPTSRRAKRFRRFSSNEHYEEPRAEGWRFLPFAVETVQRMMFVEPPAASFTIALSPWRAPSG